MKYLWVFLTACLVGIIYYNSSLPLKQSSEISSWFAALTQLLAQHLDIHLAGDVEHHIRKMAHFCEFALLGLLIFQQGLNIFTLLGMLVLFAVVKKNSILRRLKTG